MGPMWLLQGGVMDAARRIMSVPENSFRNDGSTGLLEVSSTRRNYTLTEELLHRGLVEGGHV